MKLDYLFSPMKIGNCEIKNRLVVPAMVTQTCGYDGIISDRYIKYHEEKAKGGWGLIITEDYGVLEVGRGYDQIPGFWNDEQIEKNKELTKTIHEYGSKIFCQLYYAGKQKMPNVPGEVLAPSAIKDPAAMSKPREMTIEEIKEVVEAFGSAAKRAKEAGFDGVEIHAAHGYLIAEFLSTFINKRTDEYGGCFDNRVRILDEIYASVRKNVGDDFPVICRISVNEYVTGGRTEAESYELARHLDDLGVDAINVSNGAYASDPNHHVISSMFADHAFNMDTAKQIKELVSCPIMLVNRINDPKMADTLIKMNKTDFIDMGRGSIADPYLPKKAMEGKFEEINYCIGCLQGCEFGLFTPAGVTCLVNPRVTQEYVDDLSKVENSKNVMIIGTGPAGMMAARTAAKKGHKVTVYDKDTHFGGAFRSAAYPMGKGELSTVISSYRKQCLDLGVEFKMGVEVNEEVIKDAKPEAIIVATGSIPFTPNILGSKGVNVVNAEDVLYGNVQIPQGPVVVCGGGEVGCETAEFISQTNRDVSVLEMQPQVLTDMVPPNMVVLLGRMIAQQIKIVTDATVSNISENSVSYQTKDGNEVTIPATTVVSAFGYKAYNPLEEIAKANCKEVYVVGSAVKAGNAMTATNEGYNAALKL
ncbi:MAG: FAD-dependent oxidoreductase [Thomasclavelia sp.]|jgi:2,4-dienoyl-CoA reductase-like NADH-dependent reductase (Old Yellow Enzyme family)/thioredoxin reductase|nr:FAD-dependent oxidoreductase [Thomasclavelia sp.]